MLITHTADNVVVCDESRVSLKSVLKHFQQPMLGEESTNDGMYRGIPCLNIADAVTDTVI